MIIPVTLYNYYSAMIIGKEDYNTMGKSFDGYVPVRLMDIHGLNEMYKFDMLSNIPVIDQNTIAWLLIKAHDINDIMKSEDLCACVYDEHVEEEIYLTLPGDIQLTGQILDTTTKISGMDYGSYVSYILNGTVGIYAYINLGWGIYTFPHQKPENWIMVNSESTIQTIMSCIYEYNEDINTYY